MTGCGKLGSLLAARLLDAGCSLVLVVRRDRAGADRLAQAHPGRVAVRVSDLADLSGIDALVRSLWPFDGIIHTASEFFPGAVAETTPEDWDRVMAVHAGALFFLYRTYAALVGGGEGRLVVLTDGMMDRGRRTLYRLAKHAERDLVAILGQSGGPVRVREIAPSLTVPSADEGAWFAAHASLRTDPEAVWRSLAEDLGL